MTFVLGSKSRTNLQGVHPDLVRVVERAIDHSRPSQRSMVPPCATAHTSSAAAA